MSREQRAVILVGAGLLVLWLASAATWSQAPDPARTAQPPAAQPAMDPDTADVRMQAERLRVRLESAPVPISPERNPFEFYARPAPPVPTTVPAVDPTPLEPPARPGPPPVALIGIGADRTADGVMRTAVISGVGQLFLVKEGEMVTPRYQVVAIGADAVELLDVASGEKIRLALR